MYIENNEGFSGTLRSESRRTFLRLCQPADVVRKMMWSKRHCEKLKKEHRHRSVRLRLTDSYTIPHDARTPTILRLVHIRSERLSTPLPTLGHSPALLWRSYSTPAHRDTCVSAVSGDGT
jgi:hypothetical protein